MPAEFIDYNQLTQQSHNDATYGAKNIENLILMR